MGHMLTSHHEEHIGDFHIHDLESPLKVNHGQSARCTVINWAMLNIFVHIHHGPRRNRLDDMGHFHLRDLALTSSRSSKVNVLRILKGRYRLPKSVS